MAPSSILLCESDAYLLDLTFQMLRMAGMRHITPCRDTHRAFAAASERRFQSILIADDSMPLSGIELLARLRSKDLLKGAAIILLCKSASSLKLRQLQIIDPKAQMMLRPFSAAELVQRMSPKPIAVKKPPPSSDNAEPTADEEDDSFLL